MTNLVQFPGLGLEFNINRVAFTIGGLDVYWYGVLIATGFLLALVFAFRYAVDFGIDADRLVDVVLVGSVCAVICARAYYVIFSPVPYESFADMIDIRQGGLAIYGGVIGAAVFGGLACKWRKLPILPTFDLVAMGFLIGQSIGRWGNFVNQEAFGSNTSLPWGMYSQATASYLSSWQTVLAQDGVIMDPSMPVHPTFLYESIWCAVGFFALWAYMKKRRFNGEIALMYAAWYGAGRFWIEGLRTDSLMLPGMTLRVSQLIALISVLAAVAAIVIIRRKIGKKELMVDLPLSVAAEKKFQAARADWADKLEALGQTVSLEEMRQKLPASAPHKEFVAAQKQQQEFDWEALIRQKLEQAEMDAEMQESVRQENARFAQLPVDPEERAATNSSLTQGLDEK
ncbi:prolipoprotein diacylglyceryl transferase [uncultured Allofournierella sp.]|uniref:prolipoprotein diacylglyceryl transferase n=1 Tax=uncultured Allofournierella sp. TaxID=1940258 RepID=UPI0025D8752C|nr:prolipoprotein diacylglyceryl transferase [uncultured Fournierella sp.]